MNKKNLTINSSKKLQLKKTAISNLAISDEKMKMLIGGLGNTFDTSNAAITNCTSWPTTNDTK
ncbi:hypothetical protein [Ferruginibacter profundus]